MRWLYGLVVSAALTAGCASTGVSTASPTGDLRVLTAEQIASSSSRILYDVIDKQRPEWLRNRGVSSATALDPQTASVYMNGMNLGDIQFLKQVNTYDIKEVRYFTAAEAIARFGMGHPRGVIEIIRQ